MYRVLIIDDDPGLLSLLRIGLERSGYDIATAICGEDGLRKAYDGHPDAVILDVAMPGIDGWTVCQRLTQVCDTPIIMLTARSSTAEVVRGLSIGAVDYIVKPCSLDELRARLLKALDQTVRHLPRHPDAVFDDGWLCVDLRSNRVLRNGKPVHLTPTELRLLTCLVSKRGEIVSHHHLLTHVWGPEYVDEAKYLSVYIRYLRRKIEPDPASPRYIRTKYRVGYLFDAISSSSPIVS